MPVAASHFFGLVAHELIDDPLVDFGSGKVRGERMPENMKTRDEFPIACGHRLFQMMMGLPSCQWRYLTKSFPLAKRLLTARMVFYPFLHDAIE